MNARNKNGQLTFESTLGSTEKAESEVKVGLVEGDSTSGAARGGGRQGLSLIHI